MVTSITQQLVDLLGPDNVLPQDRLDEYRVDGLTPQAAVRPGNRHQIGETLAWAASQNIGVFPRGGGTQLVLGNIPNQVDLSLDLGRCNQILDYQPSDLTVSVESGIILDVLQRELARGGKFLPLEAPMSHKATVGGILACSASGPLRTAYGLPRDWLIGIKVAGSQGFETKAGGKVVKNVTGYDLGKLYTGSMGTLGVIVEATFKLTPLALDSGALWATFSSTEMGADSGAQLLRHTCAPQGLQVVDELAGRRLTQRLNQGTGEGRVALSLPKPGSGGAALAAFFSGRNRAVRRKLQEAAQLLRDKGASQIEILDSTQSSALLRNLTDLGWDEDMTPLVGLRISVRPSAVAPVLRWVEERSTPGPEDVLSHDDLESRPSIVADPGFGSVRLLWWSKTDQSSGSEHGAGSSNGFGEGLDYYRLLMLIHRVRSMARDLGGSVLVEHVPLAIKAQIDVWGDPPEGIEIMRRIKQKLDPAGILNPGRFVGGI